MTYLENFENSPLKYPGLSFNHSAFKHRREEWNQEEQKWQHKWVSEYLNGDKRNFFDYDNQRENGVFMIMNCISAPDKNKESDVYTNFNVHCNANVDNFIQVHPDWHDGWINPVFRNDEFGNKFCGSIEDSKKNFLFQDMHIIFDGKPNFYITYTNIVNFKKPAEEDGFLLFYEISNELEDLYIRQRPHHCARTLGELFKLIIDWDLSYHHFNNRENIALICHKIMGSIEMPNNVYDAISSEMPDSIIAKYIKGIEDTTSMGERPQTPQIAIDWFKEKYWHLRHTIYDSYHNTPNVNDIHYYKKILAFR